MTFDILTLLSRIVLMMLGIALVTLFMTMLSIMFIIITKIIRGIFK